MSELGDQIVDRVLHCLNGRGGFDGWWQDIDPEIQDEIKQELSDQIAGLRMATHGAGGGG